MRPLFIGLAASLLVAGAASAQTTTQTGTTQTGTSQAAAPATSGTPAATSNRDSASGNDNQGVATTNANAATPAKGSNSFTQGEARRRIRSEGFAHVSGLHKDQDGVWRGTASKGGKSTGVWLDYKGNIGTSES